MAALTLVNWNVAWRNPKSRAGQIISESINAQRPELVCLIEVSAAFDLGPGDWISSSEDYGYPKLGQRRKVSLFSRNPWRDISHHEGVGLPPGRTVSGITDTSLGAVRVVGVCIPWKDAHVSTGRRDSARWQEHTNYLEALRRVLGRFAEPTIVVGDFNQTIPRSRAPLAAYDLLQNVVQSVLTVATIGLVGDRGAVIDHVAHSADMRCRERRTLPSVWADQTVLSDHSGIVVELETSRP